LVEGRVICGLVQSVVRLGSQQWLCVCIGFSRWAIGIAFGSRVLNGRLRSEGEGRRKSNLVELRHLNISTTVIRMISSRTVILAGYVARTGENRIAYKFCSEHDVHGSVHRNIKLIERTNKMQSCSRIYYSIVS
jgi:hypothetical protein